MSIPSEAILALVCGYPARVRKERWLALYVSHVDESGKGGPVFTVGGLTAKVEGQWTAFSDRWQAVLDAHPTIEYFKLSDTRGISDEAHGKKIDAFIEIINELVTRGDLVTVHVEQYKAFFRGKMTATYDNPFHIGYVTLFQQCALGLSDPEGVIDWVFDEMDDTQYLELLHSYRRFKKACPQPEIVRRLGQEPIRRDDMKVLPLQGADLWSGIMRRSYLGDAKAQAYLKKITIPNDCFVWDERLLAWLWKKNVAQSPKLATGILYEGPKERAARLAAARKLLRFPPK